jgi:hypothetical protein
MFQVRKEEICCYGIFRAYCPKKKNQKYFEVKKTRRKELKGNPKNSNIKFQLLNQFIQILHHKSFCFWLSLILQAHWGLRYCFWGKIEYITRMICLTLSMLIVYSFPWDYIQSIIICLLIFFWFYGCLPCILSP